ncbi:MAG: pilus assembly protein PilM [Planctomycetota bacterium]|nr:MAG: pilus assembly protein PilM [Planctomycetota bacterium]
MQLLTRKKLSIIGIDLGACSLRAVQLRKKQDRWQIHHWLNLEHKPTSNQAPPLDYQTELRLAFGSGTFFGKQTVLLLNPPDVEYKLVEVPPAVLEKPTNEIRDALQFELDRQLSWPVSESEMAVWPVQPGSTSNANAMVAVMKTSKIQSLLEILNTRHLDCVCADIVPNAMIQLFKHQHNQHKTQSTNMMWSVLDLGFRSSRLYLIHDNRPVYVRVVGGSGLECTEILAKALHVDFRIAEQYKCIYGIKQTERGFRSVTGGLAQIQ